MGCYRKAKLAIDSFRDFASKIVTRTDSVPPIQRVVTDSTDAVLIKNYSRIYGFYSSSLIASKPNFQIGGKHNYHQPFINVGRRFFSLDRYQVQHFKPRRPRRWFRNPRTVLVVVLVSSGVLISAYYGNLETVPYTKRTHLVILSKDLDRQIGEVQFERVKTAFKGKILPAIHPQSVRVRLIARDIIEALQRGLMEEHVWSDIGYASDSTLPHKGSIRDTFMALSGDVERKWEGEWRNVDEILDDKWVQQSLERGQACGSLPDTKHLEGLKWEILVVDEPVVNAFCLPGGKIVVFTGLFQYFKTDTEIATILGHEVGHVVARHAAEMITKNLWLAVLQLVLVLFVSMPDIVNAMSLLLLRLPFSRRMEMEADYIGLLLMASAGYDPRVAPLVYEKLGRVTGDSALRDYLSTHPSGKKRAKVLAQARVMEEALSIYREVKAGRGVQGFL